MHTYPKILAAVFFAVLLAACPSPENRTDGLNSQNNAVNSASMSDNADHTKDDIEEFETIVKLPFHPEDVAWHEETPGKKDSGQRIPSPPDKKLTAVVKFKIEEADKIVAEAAKHQPGTPVSMNAENWFPAELIALTQISGDETLKGTAYAANDFFQAPYFDGKITRIENSNYFVLELHSK